jgi:hypothetical protein
MSFSFWKRDLVPVLCRDSWISVLWCCVCIGKCHIIIVIVIIITIIIIIIIIVIYYND